jgi:hypothetical protein
MARGPFKKYKILFSTLLQSRHVISSTKSGWINEIAFEDWFFHLFLPHAQRLNSPKVLIGDNLSSHFTVRVILTCKERNIRFVPLLPNSTHLVQPLDVAFFRPMKVAWWKELKVYKDTYTQVKVVAKCDFPDLLHQALDRLDALQPQNKNAHILCNQIAINLTSWFWKASIFPFNLHVVYRELPDYVAFSDIASSDIDDLQPASSTCPYGVSGSLEELKRACKVIHNTEIQLCFKDNNLNR